MPNIPKSYDLQTSLATAFADGRPSIIRAVICVFLRHCFSSSAQFLLDQHSSDVRMVSVLKGTAGFPTFLTVLLAAEEDTQSPLLEARHCFMERPTASYALYIKKCQWLLYQKEETTTGAKLYATGDDMGVELSAILTMLMREE